MVLILDVSRQDKLHQAGLASGCPGCGNPVQSDPLLSEVTFPFDFCLAMAIPAQNIIQQVEV